MPDASVTSSKVPSPRLRKRRSPGGRRGLRRPLDRLDHVPALDAVDVEPAVAVEVEQPHASRHRLGQWRSWSLAVVEDEAEAGGLGVVDEFGSGRAADRRRPA